MKNYITIVEKTSKRFRSHVIIYNGFYHFAEMHTIEQLEKFSNMLGFTYTLEEVSQSEEHILECNNSLTVKLFDG